MNELSFSSKSLKGVFVMNLNSINESISRIQKIQEEIKSPEYKDAYDICKKEFDEIKRR